MLKLIVLLLHFSQKGHSQYQNIRKSRVYCDRFESVFLAFYHALFLGTCTMPSVSAIHNRGNKKGFFIVEEISDKFLSRLRHPDRAIAWFDENTTKRV